MYAAPAADYVAQGVLLFFAVMGFFFVLLLALGFSAARTGGTCDRYDAEEADD